MADTQEHASSEGIGPTGGHSSALESALERICFLEWRLEQQESLLTDERRTTQSLREELAQVALRDADGARRMLALEERLAEKQRELAEVTQLQTHGSAQRSALELRMRALGDRSTREIAELCRELMLERQRASVKAQALESARSRLAALEKSRDAFFGKLLEWQQMVNREDLDLAEFIAELRGEIMNLADENAKAAEREETLREALVDAGVDPLRLEPANDKDNATPRFLRKSPNLSAPIMPPKPRVPPPKASAPPPSKVETAPPAAPRKSPQHDDKTPEREKAPLSSVVTPLAVGIGFDDARRELGDLDGEEKKRAHALLRDLRSIDRAQRKLAAKELTALAGEQAAASLVAAFNASGELEERTELLGLMARAGSRTCEATVARAARSDAPLLRAAAVAAALRLHKDDEAAMQDFVRAGLTDGDACVRRRTVLALSTLPRFDATETIIPMLDDPEAATRRAAAAALSGARGPAVESALGNSLFDDVVGVRTAAAESLGRIWGADLSALPRLRDIERRQALSRIRRRITVSGKKAALAEVGVNGTR